MIKKILLSILMATSVYTQQQTDIPWPTLANSDWPMIKHDPQLTGRSPYKGPQKPNIIWVKDMPNGIFSGPVIGENNNIFFGSYYVFGDEFYSYTPDGEEVWVYQTGNGRATQSGVIIDSSGTIYFGSRDSCLYALNPDGTLKWSYNTSGAIIQEIIPNIDLHGNIYVTNFKSALTDEGELYSIKQDGTLKWHVTYETGFTFKSPTISPDGNTIYIPARDSNLYALNLDGSIKWKFSCGNIPTGVMVDSDGNIYLIPNQFPQFFYSIYPDGNIRWMYQLPLGGAVNAIPTIDFEGNLYAIVRDSTCCPYYPILFSLNYEGELRWTYLFDDEEDDEFWQPLICDSEGTIYVGSTKGYNYYAISSDGELKWKLPLMDILQQVDNTGTIASNGTLFLGVHYVSTYPSPGNTLLAIRDTVTSVEDERGGLNSYKLEQNYPNPFNSATNIKYTIPQSERIMLKVYDLMGKEVSTLLDRYQTAGGYDVIFQADNIVSGIYFYQLQAGDFIATKKFILLK
jgi:outer membrane protein assembly factor BamB